MSKPLLARLLLTAALVAAVSIPAGLARAQDGPDGVWNGAIEVPGQTLDVIVTLRPGAEGAWSGTIDIPAQGLADFPLSDIAVAAGAVTFKMAGVPGEPLFTGTWDESAQTISGDFEQAGNAFPFSLTRSGDAPGAVSDNMVDAATAEKLVGTWSGAIDTGTGSLRIIFHFSYEDGALGGTMDSPDQGQNGLPVSEITFDGTTLRADLTYAGAYYEGRLMEDGTFEGAWNQGGGQAGLKLSRQ